MKVFRSPEQLVKIYRASQAGVLTKEIAEEQGIPPGSVATALSQLNKYFKGKDRGQSKRSSAYRQAVRLIRRQQRQEPPQATTAPHNHPLTPVGDNFTFLRKSFERFEHDLATFIEVESNSRCATLRAENAVLREENERLRKDEPRTIDWIDALQDTLAKEET